jgi:type I restriction enzyme S subunit
MKNGWEQKTFENCIEHVEYTRKVQRKDFLLEGQFPVISQEAEFTNGFWDDEADLFKLSKPVIIFGDHTQVLKYVDFDFVLGADGVKILQSRSFLWPKFFFYQLQATELPSLGYARHYRLLKELVISIPPLSEQQRIVGLLDEAFGGLATAQAHAAQNLQNARDLFESHLNAVFTQRGEGWVERTLGDVCEFENGDRGKNYPNREEYVEAGVPWINTGHIQPDGALSQDEMNFITRAKFDSLRSGKIQLGDLVYCLRGATLGKTAIVDPYTEGAVASSLVIIRPSASVDSRFLYFFLVSPDGQSQIKLYDNGAAQPNLGAKSVAKYVIPVPARTEQRRVADALDELRAETQRLTRIYEQKLAALAALKKSLLHQAFCGEL